MEIQLKPITLGIIISSIIAIIAGAYLYTQGLKIWSIAKENLNADDIQLSPVFPNNRTKKSASKFEKHNIKEEMLHAQVDQITKSSSQNIPASEVKANEFKVKTITPYANLRSGPNLTYPVISVSHDKDELVVIGWHLNWFRVKNNNKIAWIRNDLVKISADTSR